MEVTQIPIDQIKPQVLERPIDEERLNALSNSIKAVGILEPLLVVQLDNIYYLVAGQRRLKAAGRAGMATVPCIIIEADHEAALRVSLHENLYREDLNPVDEARLYAHLRDEMKYSNRKIAELVSKKEPYISQRLTMLTWDPLLVDAIAKNELSFSNGRELAQVTDTTHRRYLLRYAIQDGATYRLVREWVQDWKGKQHPVPPVEEPPLGADAAKTSSVVMSDCYWCEGSVTMDKIIMVYMCDKCFEQLDEAKKKSRETGG